jgi:hypothetical protein
VDPDQLVFELPAQRGQVFLLLEMGEDPVGQHKDRLPGRDRIAEAGQIVELPEGPRERRLAALVRTGHHKNAFRADEVKLVANHGRGLGHELGRQRQVE